MATHTPRAPADMAGRMAGEYRLGRKLGEGGFGAVYEAEHPLLKRKAAVKVLHQRAERNSDPVLRFVTEAQAVNQIKSRHIVDVFSFGELPDGRLFYVMDLLEGEPLDRYLERVSRMDIVSALELARPIAEALEVAHGAGIVHRDLKPQNIFLTWDPKGKVVPKLLDFGMAKLLDDSQVHTVTGTPVGTPLYMSPEQALGGKVDGRSDVYAFGVLLYELVTGQRPITGETLMAVLVAHINEPPRPPSEACAEVPPSLDEPILRMLKKNPDERPATATEALASVIRAAEASGYVVPEGLPELSPPPAPSPGASSAEPSLEHLDVSSTARGAVARSSAEASRSRGLRWSILGLLLALGSGLSYVVGRVLGEPVQSGGDTRAGATSVATHEPPPPQELPQSSSLPPRAEEPAPSSSVAPPVTSGSARVSSPKLKKRGTGTSPGTIPSDLESPF